MNKKLKEILTAIPRFIKNEPARFLLIVATTFIYIGVMLPIITSNLRVVDIIAWVFVSAGVYIVLVGAFACLDVEG